MGLLNSGQLPPDPDEKVETEFVGGPMDGRRLRMTRLDWSLLLGCKDQFLEHGTGTFEVSGGPIPFVAGGTAYLAREYHDGRKVFLATSLDGRHSFGT